MTMADRLLLVGNGFLLAVLWFDLMFDVQVLRHRGATTLPEPVLDSISRYYRRVTTDASPMGRLVALSMLVFVGSAIAQALRDGTPGWVSVTTLVGTAFGPGLAVGRVFGNARRLGRRADDVATQSVLARRICRDHLVCLAAMTTVLIVQLASI